MSELDIVQTSDAQRAVDHKAHWTPTTRALPTTDTPVETITPGGDQRTLRYHSGLWWLPDGSMYVYFTPTHWREADDA